MLMLNLIGSKWRWYKNKAGTEPWTLQSWKWNEHAELPTGKPHLQDTKHKFNKITVYVWL